MIFLSKKGNDPYINMLARGYNTKPTSTDDFNYNDSNEPIVFRGILKTSLMQKCIADSRDFYYIDTGYFGNEQRSKKIWHRVVKNGLQHTSPREYKENKVEQMGIRLTPWKKSGERILVAPPGPKPCKHYGIDQEQWLSSVINTLTAHTDRPIEIRKKPKLRNERIAASPLSKVLSTNIYALVTFNSIAAIEAIMHGIPVFVLCPDNAAISVGSSNLSSIEAPIYPSASEVYNWLNYLAHNQYHVSEFNTGSIIRKVNENS